MSKVLSPSLTTLDFLKAAALILMVVDHLGFYFFLDRPHFPGDPHLWFRAVGRWCVPIWFFLIGYARSRDLSPPIWIWGGALVGVQVILGGYVLPLNILFTMILIRLMIDHVARVALRDLFSLGTVVLVLTVFSFSSSELFEYGTLGFVLALIGYVARHRGEAYGLLAFRHVDVLLMGAGLSIFVLTERLYFSFSEPQFLVMLAGCTAAVMACLYLPKREWPGLTVRMPRLLVFLLQFCGRRTMELYVIHISLFMLISLLFGVGNPVYGWLDWDWSWADALVKARLVAG